MLKAELVLELKLFPTHWNFRMGSMTVRGALNYILRSLSGLADQLKVVQQRHL